MKTGNFRTKVIKHRRVFLSLITAVIAIAAGGYYLFFIRSSSPIPKNILANVDFPIYYPDQDKLPDGYTLDLNSFSSPQKNTVIYSVSYDNNKRLIFSAQPKPSDAEIQNFYTNGIPLRNHLQSSLGPVEIGAYDNQESIQSVISLPITKDPTWILITGPHDINEEQIKEVLESLKK